MPYCNYDYHRHLTLCNSIRNRWYQAMPVGIEIYWNMIIIKMHSFRREFTHPSIVLYPSESPQHSNPQQTSYLRHPKLTSRIWVPSSNCTSSYTEKIIRKFGWKSRRYYVHLSIHCLSKLQGYYLKIKMVSYLSEIRIRLTGMMNPTLRNKWFSFGIVISFKRIDMM